MKLKIYQVDAFASEVFKGNPAAVIPLESWIEEDVMQKIAMENNLSETAFIVPTEEGFHIRWFTPEYEIDLCGHATLASAYVIKNFLQPHSASIHFTTQKAGELRTVSRDGIYTLDFPSRPPEPCETPSNLLTALGVSAVSEVLRSRDYFVVLPNEEAVRNAEPDFSEIAKLDTIGVIITAKASSGTEADVVSRCFYPGLGIQEDPVTGSAHCNIVPYWAQKLGKTSLICEQASQRSGLLNCSLEGDRVKMSGKCVLFLKGEIYL